MSNTPYRRLHPGTVPVYTIGFSGRTITQLLDRLGEAGVKRVVDVRARAGARFKPDFNKSKLREALAAEGIGYVHLRPAGNPYRKEWKADLEEGRSLYGAYLDEHPEVFEELEEVIDGTPTALLCLERRSDECHRGVLLQRWRQRRPDIIVSDL